MSHYAAVWQHLASSFWCSRLELVKHGAQQDHTQACACSDVALADLLPIIFHHSRQQHHSIQLLSTASCSRQHLLLRLQLMLPVCKHEYDLLNMYFVCSSTCGAPVFPTCPCHGPAGARRPAWGHKLGAVICAPTPAATALAVAATAAALPASVPAEVGDL